MEEIQVLSQDVLVSCILLGLTALVGVVGNGLMLRALVKYRALRTDFFLVLGSVAVADSLCLLVAVPMHVIYLTMATGPVNDAWCKSSKYLDAGTGFVAAYHLVVLAVLRGILLTSRGRNPPTARQTLGCVLLLWLMALLAAIPFLLTVVDLNGYCHYAMDTDVEREVLLLNSFSCYVPVALILLIYLTTHLVGQRYFQDSYSHKEKQMSKLVTVVVSFFVLLQLPFRVLDTHVMYQEIQAEQMDFPDEDKLESLYIARNYLLCLMMADKAIRPIICSQLAPGLSQAFDEVINCTKCHQGNRPAVGDPARNGHGPAKGRHPSTSSRAPLTPGSEGGSTSEHGEPVDELEIVQL
ncbi:somatostatin receptor type 1-like [Babylonia areolata]|uniref:somatostatin receptor type 1-like n=1 Tax=Babylonia areolata TaxID=304850 RepID=UPI003FD60B9F